MLKKYSPMAMAAIVMLFALVTAVPAYCVFGPENPYAALNDTFGALRDVKGPGNPIYGYNASGKELTAVRYDETWFKLPYKVQADYINPGRDDMKLQQITLNFPSIAKRTSIVSSITKYLGVKPTRAGKPDSAAPTVYEAVWNKDKINYFMGDFGDRITVDVTLHSDK